MAEYDLISKTALLEHLDMAMECENCPRNADKELYKCVHNPTLERCTCSDIAQICTRITEFATFADVQPIKKGHWYHNTSKYISELDAYFIQARCSCCGKYSDRVDLYSTIMSNEMCSHCGARMDGDIE